MMGYLPLNRTGSLGLKTRYSEGAHCGTGKPRDATVTFLCDPEAGLGLFNVPLGQIETACSYEFEWRTNYACPICDSTDWTAVELCNPATGQMTRDYEWVSEPPFCIGQLPPRETGACTIPTVPCPAGSYLLNGVCTHCPDGTFSSGGGQTYAFISDIPQAFTSTGWIAEEGHFVSWGRESTLSLAVSFATQGSLSFRWKLYNYNENHAEFYLDGQAVLSRTLSQLDYVESVFPLSSGRHTFTWAWHTAGPESPKDAVTLLLTPSTRPGLCNRSRSWVSRLPRSAASAALAALTPHKVP